MALLGSLGFKKSKLIEIMNDTDGDYLNLTVDVSDETDTYGNNVKVYVQQTKEEREAKIPKIYAANGKVFWNNNKVVNAEKKQKDGLPF